MHLVYGCLEGQPLPDVLPTSLVPPSKRSSLEAMSDAPKVRQIREKTHRCLNGYFSYRLWCQSLPNP